MEVRDELEYLVELREEEFKMLEILLVVPKGSKYGKNKYLKNFLAENDMVSNFYGTWETPNLSLLTIAAVLPDSCNITFVDEDHGEEIIFSADYDIVALTGMTQQINRSYEICRLFKEIGVYTAIGGIHVSLFPEEAQKHADTVFIGEGEKTWKLFIEDYLNKTPKKIYRAEQYTNLMESPTPRYDIVKKDLYKSFSIQTTRGCPRTCNYCTLPIMYGNIYRHKTVEQVIAEVRAILSIDKNSFIFFADDNMFINREYSKRLLSKLSELGINWGTQTDISVAEDTELLKMLYNAGCHWLFIGFESVSREGLSILDDRQWKAKKLYEYESAIERIHANGINIWGSFMFGGDNDKITVFDETLQFTLRNGIYSGSFTILTPLPGTKLFREMKNKNRITDYDWSRYTFWDVVFKPANMTADELAQGVMWVYSEFYSSTNIKKRAQKIHKRLRNFLKNEREQSIST